MAIEFTCPECRERNTVGPEFAGRHGTCAFCGAQVIVPQTSGMATAVAQPPTPVQKSSSTPWIVILAVACVVLLFCGGILAGLLLPAIQAAREAGRRASCLNKLHQIGLALMNYEATYRHLPPASGGAKGHPVSWRVAILPFMEYNSLYQQYRQNEPWDSPHNMALVKQMPKEFLCPSDSQAGEGETSYVMITGKNTIGGTPGSSGVSPSEIRNGASSTILVLEVHGLKIPWTEPRDITLDELVRRLKAGDGRIGHLTGFNVAFADGSVRNINTTIDVELLRGLAEINGQVPAIVDHDDP